MKKINILLVDHHTIVREGLRTLLEREQDLQIVGEAADGREALDIIRNHKPQVVISEIFLPLLNGIELCRQTTTISPNTQIIILTAVEDDIFIRKALAAGATGYLLKNTSSKELIAAVRDVTKGHAILSPAVTRLVIEDYLRWGEIRPKEEHDCLTPREREILQLIAEGYTNRQIAEILSISIKTVQAHRLNLMNKLDLHNQGELIKYAIQKKIIQL